MTSIDQAGTFRLGTRSVNRLGYGAMQLAGPWVMGPPADHDGAVAVLREAVELGITHIDTADAYGPHVTNELIREALHPYPESLHIVTKVGADRDPRGGWPPARDPESLRRAVHNNLKTLGLETLDLVNLRLGDAEGPQPGTVAASAKVRSSSDRSCSCSTAASPTRPTLARTTARSDPQRAAARSATQGHFAEE